MRQSKGIVNVIDDTTDENKVFLIALFDVGAKKQLKISNWHASGDLRLEDEDACLNELADEDQEPSLLRRGYLDCPNPLCCGSLALIFALRFSRSLDLR